MACVPETQREHCDERAPLGVGVDRFSVARSWPGILFEAFSHRGGRPGALCVLSILFWLQPTVRIQNQNALKCFDTKELILQSLRALEGKVLHIKWWRAMLPWLLGWRRVKQMTCDWRQLVPACPHGCLQQQHVMELCGPVTELGSDFILVRASLQVSTFS